MPGGTHARPEQVDPAVLRDVSAVQRQSRARTRSTSYDGECFR